MILVMEHGNEIVKFYHEKLEKVLWKFGWESVEEFEKKADYEQREAIINYASHTVYGLYKKVIDNKL